MRKRRLVRVVPLIGGFVAVAIAFGIARAGNLQPPGPPASTMKTLSEVEPRVAVNTSNTPGDADSQFKIASPGSYYLAGNLTGDSGKMGIEIATGDVSLDLMGFELGGVPGSLDGIRVTEAASNVTVSNGTVRDWGGTGVDISDAANGRLSNLRAFANGGFGLRAGGGSTVEACTARQNTSYGIIVFSGSAISNCVSNNNGAGGFGLGGESVISHCTANDNAGHGIESPNGRTTITGCTLVRSGLDGIHTGEGDTIINNTILLSGNDGIEVVYAALIQGNVLHRNGWLTTNGAGVRAVAFGGGGGAKNRIEGNNLSENDIEAIVTWLKTLTGEVPTQYIAPRALAATNR